MSSPSAASACLGRSGGNRRMGTPRKERQMRRELGLTLPTKRERERAERARDEASAAPQPCLNCETPVLPPRKPWALYCSDYCGGMAYLIRYRRRTESDGRAKRQDVKDTLQIREALLFTGHTHSAADESRLPLTLAERQELFAAKGRSCLVCGEPATDIDHVDAQAGNAIDNLPPLCAGCHRKKTLSSHRPPLSTVPQFKGPAETEIEYRDRVRAQPPMKACDDDVTWSTGWRGLVVTRRAQSIAEGRTSS